MKIVSLVDNTTECEGVITEHGLSIYIETAKHRILFDMGQSDAFLKNAERLGIDLSAVDIAILSHGHYDHGGGLKNFLETNNHAPIYVSTHAFGLYYGGGGRYIGLNSTLKEHDRIIKVEINLKIDEELFLFTCNERKRPFQTNCFGQMVKRGDAMVPDQFLHEQYLLVKSEGKSVLFSGCSHKGILNITEWFSPDILVGGFHFSKLDPQGDGERALIDAAHKLVRFPTKYFTAHCTGVEQYQVLKSCMGDQLEYLSAGQSVNV